MTVVGPWYPPDTYPNGVLSAVFDEPNAQLNTTVVAGTSATGPDNYQTFVWSHVYDPATNTLRVIEV